MPIRWDGPTISWSKWQTSWLKKSGLRNTSFRATHLIPKFSLTQMLLATGVVAIVVGAFVTDPVKSILLLHVAVGFGLILLSRGFVATVLMSLAAATVPALFCERVPTRWFYSHGPAPFLDLILFLSAVSIASYGFFRLVFWVSSTLRAADEKRKQ